MRHIFLTTVFTTLLTFSVTLSAEAASYYVAPNGGGSTCSSASPCRLAEGLNKAGAGDEVVLKDGVYRQNLQTRRHGSAGKHVLISAENRHRAIVEGSSTAMDVNHDFITVRGIKFDNKGDGRRGVGQLDFHSSDSNPIINDVIIEDNQFLNSGSAGVYHNGTNNIIIRHNLIANTGLASDTVGEAFYIGSNGPTPATNVEIYGNTIRNTTNNFVDYKNGARNVNVHHNIFEKHLDDKDGWCGDGLVRSQGSNTSAGNYFQNNIVRNSPDVCYMIRLSSNRVDVKNNVFHDIGGSRFIDSRTTSAAVITGNTLCNTPTGGNRGNNRLNAPQSACDAEVQRILNEMKSLPGPGAGLTPGPSAGTACHAITNPQTVPAGFGVPYSAITTTHELLIAAGCQGNDINVTVGNAQSPLLTYVWPTIHYWLGSTRKTTQLTCAEQVSGWCRKEGTATITANQNETWLIGYACQWDGSRWWCGCRTSQCTAQNATGSLWQAQLIKKP